MNDRSCDKCGAKTYYEDGIYRMCDDCGRQVEDCICKPINVRGSDSESIGVRLDDNNYPHEDTE